MKYAISGLLLAVVSIALALEGQIGIHDPSTIVQCNGKLYTYGTGGSSLISDDGWTCAAVLRFRAVDLRRT